MTYKERACLYCGKHFAPKCSRTKHCSRDCVFLSIASNFSGDDCWNWPMAKFKSGYGQFSIGVSKPDYAHRVSYRIFKGEIPKGSVVLHACDNPSCFNPKHLSLGTHADNVADMWKKGRQQDYSNLPCGPG